MGQLDAMQELARLLQADAKVLNYARNVATAVVSGPADHCAATLSALLVFQGIYPNGGESGRGDLEPWVPSLAFDLEKRRQWAMIKYGADTGPEQPIAPGDVAVVLASASVHHIFLIVDPRDQRTPLIADNQGAAMHARPLAGDAAKNFSPVSYLLRAPV